MIGSTIDGKFLIKELLGQGGMGSVYSAEHTATGRRCAVKVINSTDLTKNSQILSRFEREARAAGAIDTNERNPLPHHRNGVVMRSSGVGSPGTSSAHRRWPSANSASDARLALAQSSRRQSLARCARRGWTQVRRRICSAW